MKRNLGVYMNLNEAWRDELRRLEAEFEDLVVISDKEETAERIAEIDVLVAVPMPEELFRAATRLQALFVPFVGLNHLPRELLIERGVRVFNVHGNARSVAERALALALAFLGRVVEYHNDLSRDELWHGFWARKGIGDGWSSLFGTPCSVFGTGAIGRELAALLHAFGCRVTGFRRDPGAGTPAGFDAVAHSIEEAIDAGEVLFLALPLTPDTEGVFGEAELRRAEGKLIVNVGRGELIQEKPLFDLLSDGTVRGAALDVWFDYPQDGEEHRAPSQLGIHKLPNVVCSPHIAGFTPAAVEANRSETLQVLRSYLCDEEPTNECDLRRLY